MNDMYIKKNVISDCENLEEVNRLIKNVTLIPSIRHKVLTEIISILVSEKIPVLFDELCLFDNPTDGVYMFMGKDNNGNKVAFEFSYNKDTNVYTPCLTIESNVIFYKTCMDMTKDWMKHDALSL